MKHARKLAGILLAMVMALALALPAFAEETTYSLTITGTKTGHTYDVYQIFTGEISGTNNNTTGENNGYVLSNVKYGKNYGGNVTVGDPVPEGVLKTIKAGTADAFLASYAPAGEPFKSVDSTDDNTVISGLPAGYYMVKDKNAVTGQDAATKYILQVVGDTTVEVKSAVPTVEKKVKENNKLVTGNTDDRIKDYTLDTGYNDVADYNIGDSVPFQLIGTLPERYDDYTTYKYVFHDTLSAGLTYNNNAKVYVVNGTDKKEVTSGFKVTSSTDTSTGKTSLTITFDNLKTINEVTKSSYILVEYTATLNNSAAVGLPGNPNEVYLEFSNNPNQGGEGETGTTPKDEVIVFTYELDVTKVDGENADTKLKDAEFKLKNSAGKWAIVDTDGKITGWAGTEDGGTTLTSNDEGLFSVIGLDDGTYYLKETKAPTGYNKLDSEITLVVTATTANNQTWNGIANTALTEINVKVGEGTSKAGDVDKGTVGITVENFAGSTLPSTGGIGTTIFYVVGSILVLAAVVLLITKKRMSEDK